MMARHAWRGPGPPDWNGRVYDCWLLMLTVCGRESSVRKRPWIVAQRMVKPGAESVVGVVS